MFSLRVRVAIKPKETGEGVALIMAKENRFYIPAEWERQLEIWTAWPSHDDDDRWPAERLEKARDEVAQMVRALSAGEKVVVLAFGDAAVRSAEESVGKNANVLAAGFGDIWLRDTAPVFGFDGTCLTALRFQLNGWGGKYVYQYDDTVGEFIATQIRARIKPFDFILEGGAVEHDGNGTILTTRQCLLNKNRNRNWDEKDAEAALREAYGAERIIWFDKGLKNDHTDGHIDNLARFVAPGRVLCTEAFGKDDPNTKVYAQARKTLEKEGFEVISLPSPGPVKDAKGKIVPASHANFVIGNRAVVMPSYGSESESAAVEVLEQHFPGRTVTAVRSDTLLTGGGSFHCITQHVPALRSEAKE